MTNRIIAAVSRNGVIGIDNDLCWKLSDDLRLFKQLTVGRVVLMGRKTFESMGFKPLPDRINVVMSRFDLGHPDVRTISDEVEMCQLLSGGNVDVIGGAEIYNLALRFGLIDECIISHVDTSVGSVNGKAVAVFPFHKMSNFVPAGTVFAQEANIRNEFSFKTIKYVRG